MLTRRLGALVGFIWLALIGCGSDPNPANKPPTSAGSAGKSSIGNTGQNSTTASGGVSTAASMGWGGAATTLGSSERATNAGGTSAPTRNGVGGSFSSNSGGMTSSPRATGGTSNGEGNATGGVAANSGGTATGGTTSNGGATSEAGGTSSGQAGADTAPSFGGAAGSKNGAGQAGTANLPELRECFPSSIAIVNTIVLGDAAPSGADVEGRMWVAGNATFDGYSVASAVRGNCSDPIDYGLVIGGDSSGQVNAGKTRVAIYGANRLKNLTSCGVFADHPVDFVALSQQLLAYSAALATLPATGTLTDSAKALVLEGKNTGLNVFHLTAAQLTSAIRFRVTAPAGSTVLVNVSGTDVLWNGVGFEFPDGASCRGSSTTWCRRVLYNLYEATKLELGGIGVQGSILAPHAALSGGGGNVDGQVVVESLGGGIEFHPYLFEGCLRP